MDAIALKRQLRHSVERRLASINDEARMDGSVSARSLLEAQEVWNRATRILFYAPLRGELDVWPLFEDAVRSGKEAYLPRFVAVKPLQSAVVDPNTPLKQGVNDRRSHDYVACAVRDLQKDLKIGQFGIREPVE